MVRQNKGVGAPTCLQQTGDGNLRPTVAQHCANAKCCVYDGQSVINCRTRLGFQSCYLESGFADRLSMWSGQSVKTVERSMLLRYRRWDGSARVVGFFGAVGQKV